MGAADPRPHRSAAPCVRFLQPHSPLCPHRCPLAPSTHPCDRDKGRAGGPAELLLPMESLVPQVSPGQYCSDAQGLVWAVALRSVETLVPSPIVCFGLAAICTCQRHIPALGTHCAAAARGVHARRPWTPLPAAARPKGSGWQPALTAHCRLPTQAAYAGWWATAKASVGQGPGRQIGAGPPDTGLGAATQVVCVQLRGPV